MTAAIARVKCFVGLCALFSCANAWSCSCFGIASIDETIAQHPILVEAQVVSLEEVHTPQYGRQAHSVTLAVKKNLKGALSKKTFVLEDSMCYTSLYLDLMREGHTYVLPLATLQNGRYRLADCAHSGLELIDGKLYAFEQTKGIDRKLKFYRTYEDFQRRLRKRLPRW